MLCVSPSSLTVPASSTWWSLGSARNYAGQQAVQIQDKVENSLHKQIYSNSNMETCSELELNGVVLVKDLTNTITRGIHPALGRIIGFLAPETKSQAIVKYSQQTNQQSTINRPISKLVRIVKANEIIHVKGKCFCPLANKQTRR